MTSPKNPIITASDVRKVAHLARLNIAEEQIDKYVDNLSHILELISQIDAPDTTHVTAMSSSLETDLVLREDIATAPNQRELVQKLTPHTESGFYLVPQVIE